MIFSSASVIFSLLLSFWVSNCTQRFGLCLLLPVGLQSSPLCFQLRLWLRTQGHIFWMLFSCSCLFCSQVPATFVVQQSEFHSFHQQEYCCCRCLGPTALHCRLRNAHRECLIKFSFVFAKLITSGGTFHFSVNSLFMSLFFLQALHILGIVTHCIIYYVFPSFLLIFCFAYGTLFFTYMIIF